MDENFLLVMDALRNGNLEALLIPLNRLFLLIAPGTLFKVLKLLELSQQKEDLSIEFTFSKL
jgi:hypothetical protein